MRALRRIILFFALFAMVCSCDYLDIEPTEISSEQEIFSDIKTAELALGQLYRTLYWDHGDLRRDGFLSHLGACTDEMYDHWETPASRLLYNAGAWGPSNNPLGEWKFMYNYIRRANVFISNIDKVVLKADQVAYYSERVRQYKEEARFLRAYYFFDLFRQYGAVPLVNYVVNISEVGNTLLPRNSVTEIVNFICAECDEAATENGWDLNNPAESKQAGLAVYYKRTVRMKRVFEDKHYLFPIPQVEIDKNKNLVQNHGW